MQNELKKLVGQTVVEIHGGDKGDDTLTLLTEEGYQFDFYHSQSCCENVRIEDVSGDLKDLLHRPITKAEEVHDDEPANYNYRNESHTWTFYHFATTNGYVTIRWLGESNGYYSERVSLEISKLG